MDWQQLLSLGIVAATVVLLVGSRFRRGKFSFQRGTQCGCSAVSHGGKPGSVIYRARKGQRPEVLVKLN
jgi:hypothetical protein